MTQPSKTTRTCAAVPTVLWSMMAQTLTPLRSTSAVVVRSDGGQFSLPVNLHLSLSQLVYSVEYVCAGHQAVCNGASPTYIRQDQLLDCITSYAGRLIVRTGHYE